MNPAPRALLGSGGGWDGLVVGLGIQMDPSRSIGERRGCDGVLEDAGGSKSNTSRSFGERRGLG